ncbi:MAG TPA: metallophosphoesterase [Chthoniobacteraceae bacterium]|nr:metallophosphoesterase [Chthoniobacteraceae bacterium]
MSRLNSSKPLTRRTALRLASAPIVALGLSRFVRAADKAQGFTFIAVNDLHYFDDECAPFFRIVVTQMRASAPDAAFCLIAGDVADGGEAGQLAAIRDIFRGLEIPFHTVPGNHDFRLNTDRSGYDAIFPNKLNYAFQHEGWQFIGLDTTQGTDFAETLVAASTLAWLDSTLPTLDASAPTVAFTHFPLGEGVMYRPRNAAVVLEKLRTLNLRAAYSGHWHGLSELRVGETEVVTNRCCARIRGNRDGSLLKGWWVCHAAPDGKLTRRFSTLAVADATRP